jgi:hypothetical protein
MSTPPSFSNHYNATGRSREHLRTQVSVVHSTIMVQPLSHYWSDQGASPRTGKWMSAPPSCSNHYNATGWSREHLCTQVSVCALPHHGLTTITLLVGPGSTSTHRKVDECSPISLWKLSYYWLDQGTSLHRGKYMCAPPSCSDHNYNTSQSLEHLYTFVSR